MSVPHRFFTQKIDYPEEREVVLSGEEFTHAKTVLRVAAGSEIVLLDNSGNEYTAIVDRIEKSRLTAHITRSTVGDREAKTPLYLLCGALKGDKTELVVQKACELGVNKIGVFSSRYCSAYMNANKLERLNKVAREAAKQCLRSVAPEVVAFDNFASAIESAKEYENKLFFCEFITSSEREICPLCGSVAIIVGSEGGFAEDEYAYAKQNGWAGITLGKRILRAETAAITACSIVQFALGELK